MTHATVMTHEGQRLRIPACGGMTSGGVADRSDIVPPISQLADADLKKSFWTCRGVVGIHDHRALNNAQSGELLLPGAPRTAGIRFCCPVRPNRAFVRVT